VNQIKPYLFWIIAGVLLLVLIIGGYLTSPTATVNGTTMNAAEVKNHLDTKVKGFQNLVKRAAKGDPTGVPFDPVLDSDIKRLTEDYLLTTKWADRISPNVDEYRKQLKVIHADLVARSKVLHEPISESRQQLQWFTAYQEKTGQFVVQLRDAKALVVPVDGQTSRRGGLAPVQPAPRAGFGGVTTGTDEDPLSPTTGSKIRDVLGLHTRKGDLPTAEEYPLLTTRFRIVEALGRVVLASDVDTKPNPIVDAKQVVHRPAAIAGLEWSRDSEGFSDPVTSRYATYVRLTLTLHGTESALLAALAGLESMDRPIMLVAGSTLTRQDRLAAGARRLTDSVGDPFAAAAVMTVDVLALDYSQMRDPTSGAASAPSLTPAMTPGMPGNPGNPMGPPGSYPPEGPSSQPPDNPRSEFEGSNE